MPVREITPHRDVDSLITGHFQSIAGYRAYRPQGTNDYLLIYTAAGAGEFVTADGRRLQIVPHDVVLVRPKTYSDYGVEPTLEYWEMLWTHFRPRPEWLDLLDWPEIEPGVGRLQIEASQRQQITDQFFRVHRGALSTGPLRDRVAMNALEALLLLCEQANPNRDAHQVDSRIRQTMDHIVRHLDRKLTLDDLAEVSGLSVSRLGHRFREVVGVPPMEYVERQRIERAKQLLTMTSLSVKEVSRQVGYETQFYFSLRFKKQTGKSPKHYRTTAA